jgi:hypothetical protein
LEDYSIEPYSDNTFRSSENTIEERLILREKIREISRLELSHTIVFYDSDENDFPGNLIQDNKNLRKLYEISLSNSDKLVSYAYSSKTNVEKFFLLENQKLNYNFMIVGDGDHSLAGAKMHCDRIKHTSKDEK